MPLKVTDIRPVLAHRGLPAPPRPAAPHQHPCGRRLLGGIDANYQRADGYHCMDEIGREMVEMSPSRQQLQGCVTVYTLSMYVARS